MNAALASKFRSHADLLVQFFENHFQGKPHFLAGERRLLESMRYSLLQEGGKRFRPVLAMLTAEALGQKADAAVAFAGAVECVHTYSLIHDDLPAMDNDDFRRGQPTNHKKFDEAIAILAGDGLLTEAFVLIAQHYQHAPEIAVRLTSELAMASGFQGMVGGQAIDMGSKKESITAEELKRMHRLKTGALIRVASVGAAQLSGANSDQLTQIERYAENLGLAFQVADDILDYDPEKLEPGSYPAILGIEATSAFLKELTDTCLDCLAAWPPAAEPLREIARYNATRTA